MRRLFWLCVMIIGALVAVSPALAQSYPESYTSLDGKLTIGYPTGWYTSEDAGTIIISSTENADFNPQNRLEPGQAALGVTVLNNDASFGQQLTGDGPVEKLKTLLTGINDTDAGSFSNPVALTIGDYSAARAASTYKGSSNQFILFLMELDSDSETYVIAAGLTGAGEMARVEAKFISILSTLVYSPVPQAVPGDPISLDSLGAITASNADNLVQLSVLRAHEGRVLALAISPDGSKLFSGGFDDGTLQLWNLETGERILTLEQTMVGVQQTLFSPDGRYVAALGTSEGTLRVFDAETGNQEFSTTQDGALWYAAFSPDSQSIAFISYVRPTEDTLDSSTVWLWNFAEGDPQVIQDIPEGRFANSIAFNPEGNKIIYCGWDDVKHKGAAAWVYDVDEGAVVLDESRTGEPIDAFFTADDQPIVSVRPTTDSGTVLLWNAETDDTLGELVDALPFQTLVSPDRSIVTLTGIDNNALLFNVADGSLLTELPHTSLVFGIGYSADGRIIATSDADGRIFIWGVRANS